MRTLTPSFGKVFTSLCCFSLTASSLLAGDVVLQKVPQLSPETVKSDKSQLGPQATFALVNYNLSDTRTKARALYVSSGDDLKLANSMIDNQAATSFGFSVEDKSPIAVIDLGKVSTVRRLAATYSARPGSIDFYVMQTLPGTEDNSDGTVKLDSNALGSLKRVGSTVDDGTQGRASIDFPATSGRYVMLRWIPATQADTSFTVAEVSAFGTGGGNLLAANVNVSGNQTIAADSKDIVDSKDSKDEIAAGPDEIAAGPPGEGPGSSLPSSPPFTFIPQLVPNSL